MSMPTFKPVLDTEFSSSGIEIPQIAGIEEDREAQVQGRVDQPSLACRLPFDVTESIFLSCLPRVGPWICSPLHPSIALSRVCTNWRSTALQCPKLWARPRIVLPAPEFGAGYTPQWHRKMEMLGKAFQVWIDRSGTVPLTMLVESHPTIPSTPMQIEAQEAFSTFIDSIKQTSTRWSEFSLTITVGPGCEVLLELATFTPSLLPLLQRTFLRVTSWTLEWEPILYNKLQALLSTSGIFSTPSLRSLTIRGIWGAAMPPAVDWSPLTHINMGCTYPAEGVPYVGILEYFRRLSAIPTLEKITIAHGRNVSIDQNPYSPPLRFRNLKCIFLTGVRIPKGLGASLSLPALRELHLYFRGIDLYDIESGFVEFILCFGAQLKALALFPNSVTRESLVKILENIPRVESLTLDAYTGLSSQDSSLCSAQEPGVDCYAITELILIGRGVVNDDEGVADEVQQLRCPQLLKLELTVSQDRYEDDAVEQALVEFIASRRGTSRVGGENRLQEVAISFQRKRGLGTNDVLGKLEERGVDLDGFTLRVDTYM